MQVTCEICGNQFKRQPWEVRYNRHMCCSKKCETRRVWQRKADRFWERLERRGDDECWEWNHILTMDGYGRMKWNPGEHKAHRFSYRLHFGPIPDGMCVCHRCDNRKCCNPYHLFIGTRRENFDDMMAKGRNAFGERHPRCKLKDDQVGEIRLLAAEGVKQMAIAAKFGVTPQCIGRIINGIARRKPTTCPS